jgi:hypothetical protein
MESKKKKIGYGQKIKYVYFVKIDGGKNALHMNSL